MAALLILAVATGCLLATRIHPFLAPQAATGRGVLIVEGRFSDEYAQDALAVFRSGRYAGFITTGGPIHELSPLAEYGSYAQLSASRLRKLGIESTSIWVVPAPVVSTDRTRQSAKSVAAWWSRTHREWTHADLLSVGAHTRRSWLVFESALGTQTEVGAISLEPRGYDAARWWSTSVGFRTTVGEMLAYIYVKFTGS